jgi:hypothetical protein
MGSYNKGPTELLVFHSSFSFPPYIMVTSLHISSSSVDRNVCIIGSFPKFVVISESPSSTIAYEDGEG